MRLFTVVFTALHLVTAQPVAAAERIFFGINSWCPYSCLPEIENGRIGYTTEILRTIFEDAGFEVSLVEAPFPRLVEMARTQPVNIASLYHEEAPFMTFAPTPTGQSGEAIFVRHREGWAYEGPSSLTGFDRLGAIEGATYGKTQIDDYLAGHPENIVTLSGNGIAARMAEMLLAGRLDAALMDAQVMRYAIELSHLPQAEFDAHPVRHASYMYVGFSPRVRDPERLIEIYETGIVKLRQTGRLDEILSRYGLQDWEKVHG